MATIQTTKKYKEKRNELVLDIMRLSIIITESKNFSVQVDFTSYVGNLSVTLHTQKSEDCVQLLERSSCFSYPMEDRLWHEKHFSLDYKAINKDLEKCKQTLNDLLIDKISVDELLKHAA